MTIAEAIKKVIEGESLTEGEAEMVLEEIMGGGCTEAQIAALLTALRMKGEAVAELTGFARVMRRRAHAVRPRPGGGVSAEPLLDTCGTGGDVSGSFNISTAAAFVVAGCGLRVAKHGNRSVSSRCGSADVMEALGVRIDLPPERIAACIDEVGLGFLYAPLLHEAMRHVAPVRRQLGVRTIFNLLGPLTNPANADAQVIGVYAPPLAEMFAQTLKRLGSRRAFIVHGSDGLDELTITGSSRVTELQDGAVTTYTVVPEDVGLNRASMSEIRGGDADHNAGLIRAILRGQPGAGRDIVLLNAAAALVAGGRATSLVDGVRLAAAAIDGGAAAVRLEQMVAFTRGA